MNNRNVVLLSNKAIRDDHAPISPFSPKFKDWLNRPPSYSLTTFAKYLLERKRTPTAKNR